LAGILGFAARVSFLQIAFGALESGGKVKIITRDAGTCIYYIGFWEISYSSALAAAAVCFISKHKPFIGPPSAEI
jgi:hypothetical protein